MRGRSGCRGEPHRDGKSKAGRSASGGEGKVCGKAGFLLKSHKKAYARVCDVQREMRESGRRGEGDFVVAEVQGR